MIRDPLSPSKLSGSWAIIVSAGSQSKLCLSDWGRQQITCRDVIAARHNLYQVTLSSTPLQPITLGLSLPPLKHHAPHNLDQDGRFPSFPSCLYHHCPSHG